MAKRRDTEFPVVIGVIKKNDAEDIRVELDEKYDWNVVSLAIWYANRQGTMSPRPGGIVMRVEKLPRLIALLQRAHREAQELGLLDED